MLQSPLQFLLTITTPVVDYEAENANWNRHLSTLQIFLGPVFAIFATDQYGKTSIWSVSAACTVTEPVS